MLLSISIVTLLVCQLNAYDFKCPSASQWDFRGNSKCPNTELLLYTCLLSVTISSYLEFCGPEEIYRYGTKYVLRPNPTPTNCSVEFYQPFFFTSIGNSQCVYSKSTCSGEGQIIASNRTSREDRSCRCDYTRGYMYVIPPKNGCTCVPSEEDCSCVYRPCTKREQTLHKDYKCNDEVYILPEKIACEAIERNIITSPSSVNQKQPFQLGKLSQGFVIQQRKSALIPAFVILLLIILVVLIISLQYVFPVVINTTLSSELNLVGKKSDEYNVVKGDTIYIQTEIRSFFKVKSVVWQKVGAGKTTDYEFSLNDATNNGFSIRNVSSDNSGMYRCTVTNVLNMSNTFTFLPIYCSSLRVTNTLKELAKEFPAFQSYTYDLSINVLSLKEEIKKAIEETDTHLTASLTKLANEVYWIIFKNGVPTIIDHKKNPEKHGECTTTNLTIQNCSKSDAGTYLCVQVDENKQFLEDVCRQWTLQIAKQKESRELSMHRDDKCYVRTSIVDSVIHMLDKTGLALISGREGTGKSTLCLEIASDYDTRKFPTTKVSPFNLDEIFIDQLHGLYIIDETNFEADSINSIITEIRSKSDMKCVKVIVTCEKHYLNYLTNILTENKHDFSVFDLDVPLSIEEKKEILQKCRYTTYQKSDDGKSIDDYLNQETVEAIVNAEPWMGFPLTVKLFCNDSNLWKEKEKHFIDPPVSLVEDLKNMIQKAMQNDQDSIFQCCVLVYILREEQHVLCPSQIDEKQFRDIYKSLSSIDFDHTKYGKIIYVVKDAADKLINKYLTISGDSYTFVKRCLLKAMAMTAPRFLLLDIIENGSLDHIMDVVSYDVFQASQKDTNERNIRNRYTIFVKKLTKHALENTDRVTQIGKFIYKNWITHDDSMLKEELLNYFSNVFTPKEKARVDCSDDKSTNERTDPNEDSPILKYCTWKIILLIEELTSRGKDPWIYQNNPSDFMIIFGLIIATKGQYMVNCKETFYLLLKELDKKLTSLPQPTILAAMNSGLDIKGNTFFHYLCLFYSEDSAGILNHNESLLAREKEEKGEKGLLSKKTRERLDQHLLSKKNRRIFGKQNELNISPLELAAYLGKCHVFKVLLAGTEQRIIKKQRTTLLQITQFGIQTCVYGQGKATPSIKHADKNIKFTVEIKDLLEPDIAVCVTFGKEEEYKNILQTLSYNVNKEDLRRSFKAE